MPELIDRTMLMGGSRNFLKGGGVASSQAYFGSLFGHDGVGGSHKMATNDHVFGKIFQPKISP